jgi:hypothetical protein
MVFVAFMATVYFVVVFGVIFLATSLLNILLRSLYPPTTAPILNVLKIALIAGAVPVIVVVALFVKHILLQLSL